MEESKRHVPRPQGRHMPSVLREHSEGQCDFSGVSKGHALGQEVPWVVRGQATHSLVGHCVDTRLDPECKWNFIPGRDVNLTSL